MKGRLGEFGLKFNPLTGKPYKKGRQPIKAKTKKNLLYKPRKCQYCRRLPVQNIHHIRGVTSGGSNRQSNLIGLCASCHYKVHHGEITIEQLKRRLGIKITKRKISKRRHKRREYNPFDIKITPIKLPKIRI